MNQKTFIKATIEALQSIQENSESVVSSDTFSRPTDPKDAKHMYNSMSGENDQVKTTSSHKMRHDGDRGGQTYTHKHGNVYGATYLVHNVDGNIKANTHAKIHAEVEKQNPHLSAADHKAVAKDIHNHQKEMDQY